MNFTDEEAMVIGSLVFLGLFWGTIWLSGVEIEIGVPAVAAFWGSVVCVVLGCVCGLIANE